jgi:ATP-binding cassette subfamily B protein IrtA
VAHDEDCVVNSTIREEPLFVAQKNSKKAKEITRPVNVFSQLWQMIDQHRLRMALSVMFGVLSSVLQLSPAVFVALIIAALEIGDISTATYYAVGLIIASIVCAALFSLSTLFSHLIAVEVQANARKSIADKLANVPLGYFQRFSRDTIKKLIMDDMTDLEDGVAHLIPELTAALVAPILIIIIMFFLSPLLALAAVFPTLVGFIMLAIILRDSGELNSRFYHAKANITQTMDEVISAIPEVKTYNHEDSALKTVHHSFMGLKTMLDDWIEIMMVKNSWFYLFTNSNLLLVAPLGYYLYQQQLISLSIYVFFLLASLSFGTITSTFFSLMTRLKGQEGAINRYCALMAESELPMQSVPSDHKVSGHAVEFDSVFFRYDEAVRIESAQDGGSSSRQQTMLSPWVIDNVSLTLTQGSFTALVGPSGSGKSTLAHLVARFWDVQIGSVCIGGIDIRQLSADKLALLTSFVLQDVYIFSQTVRQNICLGRPDADEADMIAAAKSAQAHEFIMCLPQGYDTMLTDGEGLSVGQKQRLSIARALIRNAPILILDEATAYADPQSEVEVQRGLSHLIKGRTVLVIAHRLSTITTADQIVFLDHGKIIEKGKHEELLALNGRYAAQWRQHIKAKEFKLTDNVDEGTAF